MPRQDPPVMQNAVLAIEDARFISTAGDYLGCCAVWPTGRVRSPRGSTITMQVARNFYPSSEKITSAAL